MNTPTYSASSLQPLREGVGSLLVREYDIRISAYINGYYNIRII